MRRAADFLTHANACRFCAPNGTTQEVANVEKTRATHFLAQQIREVVEKSNPDSPEIATAFVARLGGREAIGEMMANDVLDIRGSLDANGKVIPEAQRLASPKSSFRDKKALLRMWDFAAKYILENDKSKDDRNWAQSLDLNSLEHEFRGLILESIKDDEAFGEQILQLLFQTALQKSLPLRTRLFEMIVTDQMIYNEFLDFAEDGVPEQIESTAEEVVGNPEDIVCARTTCQETDLKAAASDLIESFKDEPQ